MAIKQKRACLLALVFLIIAAVIAITHKPLVAFAANVPVRLFGTFIGTNIGDGSMLSNVVASGGGGGGDRGTNGMIVTNAIDGSGTNINQHVPFLLELGTNGNTTFLLRSDGSKFTGANVGQDINTNNFNTLLDFTLTMIDSNEPNSIQVGRTVVNSENYDYYAYGYDTLAAGISGSYTYTYWKSQRLDGHSSLIELRTDATTTESHIAGDSDNTNNWRFGLNSFTLHGVNYIPPATNSSAGQVLASDGGSPQQLYWTNLSGFTTNVLLSLSMDNGTNALSTGQKGGFITVPRPGTISGFAITAKGSTPTCTMDVWKIATGTALPTVANTIMGTKPALATGNALYSVAVGTWTTTVSAGDIMGVNLDAVSGASNIVFQIFYR